MFQFRIELIVVQFSPNLVLALANWECISLANGDGFRDKCESVASLRGLTVFHITSHLPSAIQRLVSRNDHGDDRRKKARCERTFTRGIQLFSHSFTLFLLLDQYVSQFSPEELNSNAPSATYLHYFQKSLSHVRLNMRGTKTTKKCRERISPRVPRFSPSPSHFFLPRL